MKSADYVAEVVSVYRAALDRVLAAPDEFAVTAAETDRLAEAFNRRLHPGIPRGRVRRPAHELRAAEQPRSRARPRRRVPERRRDRHARLRAGKRGHARVLDGERPVRAEGGPHSSAKEASGPRPPRALASGSGPAGRCAPATASSASRTPPWCRAARRSWQGSAERRPVPLRMRARLRVGEPLALWAEAGGAEAEVRGAVVEAARTKAVTAPGGRRASWAGSAGPHTVNPT